MNDTMMAEPTYDVYILVVGGFLKKENVEPLPGKEAVELAFSLTTRKGAYEITIKDTILGTLCFHWKEKCLLMPRYRHG
jgi:hypothetical protein